jgi:hypothetical protein
MFGIFNKICPYILILVKIAQKSLYMKAYVYLYSLTIDVLCEKCAMAKETGECGALHMIEFKHQVLAFKRYGM